jgi:hypothetical protein
VRRSSLKQSLRAIDRKDQEESEASKKDLALHSRDCTPHGRWRKQNPPDFSGGVFVCATMSSMYNQPSLFGEIPMDDEVVKLLREMREVMARNEARDSAWIEEIRRRYEEADKKTNRMTRLSLVVFFMLLVALVIISGCLALVALHTRGVF